MKIIHSADWHLGDNFHGFDRISEHEHFLLWLQDLIAEERPDALLLSGDIFDNANPSAQAEEQLYAFLANATRLHPGLQIIITAGNHDSGRRLQAPSPLLQNFGVQIRGLIQRDEKNNLVTDDLIIPIHSLANPQEQVLVLAVPYIRPIDLTIKKSLSRAMRDFFADLAQKAQHAYGNKPLILMAHLYAAGSEVALNDHSERLVVGGEDCIDVAGLDDKMAYVALGHIHKAQQVGGDDRMVFYAGSPVPMSFAEKHYTHGVNKIIVGPTGGVIMEQVEYTPLRKLVSIPDGGAASLADVLKQIDSLPSKKKVDADQWAYLEIKLEDNNLSPTAQTDILNALDSKAVRLCKLVRQVSQQSGSQAERTQRTLEQLRNRIPLDIALDAYLQQMGEEMSEDLIERFNIVAKEAQEHQEEESQ